MFFKRNLHSYFLFSLILVCSIFRENAASNNFVAPVCSFLQKNKKMCCLLTAGAVCVGAISTYLYLKTKHHPEAFIAMREIKGKLVTLRQIKEEYLPAYFAIFSEPVRIAMGQKCDDDVRRTVMNSYLDHNKGKRLSYCIFENETNTLIGEIELRSSGHCGNLGNWINDKYWGGGYHQEALGLMIQQHFKIHPNVQHITAHIRKENLRSYYSLKKFGFEDFTDDPDNVHVPGDYTLKFTKYQSASMAWTFSMRSIPDKQTPGEFKYRWVWS